MGFFRNSFILAFGTGFSQIIPLALMPVIGRLYNPGEYGIYSFIMSVAAVTSVMLSLRFENALILPRLNRAASLLLGFVLSLAGLGFIAACLAAAAVTFLMPENHPAQAWLWLVPVLALSQNLVQTGSMYANRLQQYKTIAASSVVIQAVYGFLGVLAGTVHPGPGGLIYSRIAGQFAGTTVLIKRAWPGIALRGLSIRKMAYFFKTYRQFPLFNMPNMLLSTASRESAVLIFTFFGSPHAAGFYGIIRAGLLMPVNLISSSLGQVYARQATLHLHQESFRAFTLTLVAALLCILALPFSLFSHYAGSILGVILGSDWADAGAYAIIILPLALLQTVTIWLIRILEITHRQHLGFRLRAVFDTAAVVALAAMLALGYGPLPSLAFYTFFLLIYELLLTATVFRVLMLPIYKLLVILAGVMALYALQTGLHVVCQSAGLQMLQAFMLESAATLILTAGIGIFFVRRLKENMVF